MAEREPVYLDYGATTPVDPRVLERMLPFFCDRYGNPGSRSYGRGRDAEGVVAQAREQLAALIGASPSELVFTAGATESNNLALKGVAEGWDFEGHLIVSGTEHPSVMQTARYLGSRGMRLTVLGARPDGRPDLDELRSHLKGDRVLVSIMHANNETGVVNQVDEIAGLCREAGAIFHCDASQSVGKLPVDLAGVDADLLSLSGHKFYAPKGVGALFIRQRSPRQSVGALMHGGNQERGMRSGTLNVPGIVGLGAAAELAQADLPEEGPRLHALREEMLTLLRDGAGPVHLNGSAEHRLPGHLNVSFDGVGAEHLQFVIVDQVELSAGSACSTGSFGPSASITALNLPEDRAHGAVRMVLGRFTTEDDMRVAAAAIVDGVRRCRG